MKYAIYSDVDGTIYSHEQKYHKDTKRDIKVAQKENIEFIMCTGNPYFTNMRAMVKVLDVDYFVGSNGAVIFDVKKDEVIHLNVMTADEAKQILDIMEELGIGADWWDSNQIYASETVLPKVEEILSNVIAPDMTIDKTGAIKDGIHKIEGYTKNIPDEIKKIDELEKRLLDINLQVSRMKPNHIEITKNGVSKGEGVKILSSKLGIELENVMTIGDSANDHSMLELVEHSYAMANGDDLTKDKANYHTSSVEQNGLGEAIIDFMFRKRLTDNFKGQK